MHKILAVDDHEEILNIIQTKLSRNGYDVHTLSDSTQVMEWIRENKPEMVLLDIMMPKITGFDIAEEIKSDSKLKKIKTVFISAKDMDFTKKKAEEIGAEGFVVKPFSPKELLSFIDSLFEA